MIRIPLIILSALALGDSFFHVKWVDSSQSSISIQASGVEAEVTECLAGADEFS